MERILESQSSHCRRSERFTTRPFLVFFLLFLVFLFFFFFFLIFIIVAISECFASESVR